MTFYFGTKDYHWDSYLDCISDFYDTLYGIQYRRFFFGLRIHNMK